MDWKKVVADYFSFTRKDRIGVLVLVALIAIVYLVPKAISRFYTPSVSPADSSWTSASDKLKTAPSVRDNTTDYQHGKPVTPTVSPQLFTFDPNTLSPEGWKQLGLRDRTIQTIQHYLGKGGQFRKPEDLQRIYGLRQDDYQRLLPFVKIAAPSTVPEPDNKYINSQREQKVFHYPVIDINLADTSAFIALPGIGSKLATRIVNFREKLGGFYSIDQIGEVYGLPDSVFQQLKQYLQLSASDLKKINVNTATLDELKSHPYIRYYIANAIIAYRNAHGVFAKLEELKKIMLVTEEVYSKISPYLIVQ